MPISFTDSQIDTVYRLARKRVARRMYVSPSYYKYQSYAEDFVQDAVIWVLTHPSKFDYANSFEATATILIKDSMFRTLTELKQRGLKFISYDQAYFQAAENSLDRNNDFDARQIDQNLLTPLESWCIRQSILGFSQAEIVRHSELCRKFVYLVFQSGFESLEGNASKSTDERWLSQRSHLRRTEKLNLLDVDVLYTGSDMKPALHKLRSSKGNVKFKGVSTIFDKKSGVTFYRARGCKRGEGITLIGVTRDDIDAATVYNFWTYYNIGPDAYMNTVAQPWLEAEG